MKKLPIFIFLLSSSFFVFIKPAFAAVLFEDNFNDGNADGWQVEHWTPDPTDPVWQSTQWVVNADKQYGITLNNRQMRTFSGAGDISWTDYIYKVQMLGKSGIDKNVVFRYRDKNNWYGLHLVNSSVILGININGNYSDLDTIGSYSFKNDVLYDLKIIVRGNSVSFYVDNAPVRENYIMGSNPFVNGKIALYVSTGEYYPSSVWFDNVLVCDVEPCEPTPTITPTPTPTLQSLIFLPGLGASWNHEEIFLGSDQPQSAWYETPFRDDYGGLIQTLQNAGYALDQNLFVFYYDWLQPINQSANDLKDYINDVVNPPPGTKVDLVGHSLGGLVGRTYIQNNPSSHDVDKLITLGSPHKGAPQVYRAWEGADLNSLLGDKERIGAGILLRLRGFSYPNLVQAVRNLVPSLSNLLFIDNYLKWNIGGMIKPESSMNQQNTWLKNLGTSPELLGLSSTVVGTNINTPRWIKIVERGKIDELLGRWEDGKPVDEEFAPGDEIVLEESAKLSGANVITLSGLDHGDLVKKEAGLTEILNLLGKTGVSVVEQPEIPFEPALVFTVASPATLRVTDPSGRRVGAGIDPPEIPNASFSDQEKIVIIPQALDGKYKVEVLGENGGGPYQLLIGQLTQKQDIWSTYQDTVGSGKTNTYTIPIDNALATTDSYLANLINLKLNNLLNEVKQQNLKPQIKAMLQSKILKTLGQIKPLSIHLSKNQNSLALQFVSRAFEDQMSTIEYAQVYNLNILPKLREILDLLDQLNQLLES